jgi:6-phosphofructokinase 1
MNPTECCSMTSRQWRSNAVADNELPGFEPAGPRKKIYFDPSKTRAGVVTCGGLCPGFNDVIRALVMELTFRYGVKRSTDFAMDIRVSSLDMDIRSWN